jgi:pyruvate formate lyase activating enzyme
LRGLVFDIQGFSVHDGPGCRTLVFLAGCPLRCSWCSNPEGMLRRPRLMYRAERCRPHRFRCVAACPSGAVTPADDGGGVVIDRSYCARCSTLACVDACFSQALAVAGRWLEVDELMAVIRRDSDYWGADGGVTFGGGEPLAQPDFLHAVLERCRRAYIHTAVETSALCDRRHLLAALAWLDWLFVDLKHLDSRRHREETGVGNEDILANLEAVAASGWGGRLVVRVPVVPGFNDDPANLEATADRVRQLGLDEVQLMPFHRLGASKYAQLGLDYRWAEVDGVPPERLAELTGIVTDRGLRCWTDRDAPF